MKLGILIDDFKSGWQGRAFRIWGWEICLFWPIFQKKVLDKAKRLG